ncbi:MAG: DUF1223 domain-containing protein [Polyangiaceae bacterium]
MRFVVLAALGTLAALAPWSMGLYGAPSASAAPSARAPVIVELFSSEGCSSCPPADAFLASLDRAQPIDGVTVIALEEHVDYWDRLGWRDPFGSEAFSDRQKQYARVLADHGIFTPEIVFDGHLVMPVGDQGAARVLMEQAAREQKAHVTLHRDGPRVSVEVTDVASALGAPGAGTDDVPEIWLAVTESGLATDVPAGENAGRRLVHAPVVRRLERLGRVAGSAFRGDTTLAVEPSWKPGALRVVAFVQLARSRRIVGAAAL